MKKVLLVILALVCVLGLTACDAVTSIFDGNNADKSFVLTFDKLDNSSTFTITTTGDEAIILPDAPTREDYVFKGWYFDRDTWQKQLTEETFLISPIYTDRNIYAKWEVAKDDEQLDLTYHIVFETNGGTTVDAKDTNRITVSPTTTREGYVFDGWYLYPIFSYLITFPYVPDNDVTLYAKWKQDDLVIDLTEYTVSFDKGDDAGGEITGEAPAPQTVIKNRETTLPANPFTKENHEFIGWSDGVGIYASGEAYTVIGDITFTARWRIKVAPISYTLSFGPGDGEGIVGTTPESTTNLVNKVITLPDNPYTRIGYMFTGWYDAVAAQVYQAQTEYTTLGKNVTLVARWQIIEYAVVYYNMDDAVNAVSNPASYTINTPTFTLAEPTRSGYSFEGWYDDTLITPADTTITKGSTGQKLFYALWKRIELSKQLSSSGTYIITGYTSNSNEIIVPEKIDGITVTEIAPGAFRNSTTLTTLIIPASVTRIGAGIVNGCHNLTNLTIPFIGETLTGSIARNSVIGYFYGEVPLGEPGAVVQNYADNPMVGFAINGKLKQVRLTSALSVPRAAFQNIASLQTVHLNRYVNSIGQSAFSGCASLTDIDFGTTYSVTSLGADAFLGCTALTDFVVPSTVTTIGSGCFASSGITNLSVPNSVTEIGARMLADTPIVSLSVPFVGKSRFYTTDAEGVLGYYFAEVQSGTSQYLSATATASYNIPATLGTLTITNPTRLMYGALSNCTNITSLTLGSTLSVISPYALYNTGLSGLELPSGLATIGEYAFAANNNLAAITLPANVTTMGTGVFQACTALDTVSIPSASRLTAIPAYGFRGATALVSLLLPEGIRFFGDYAFQGCSALPIVNISSNATTIGAYAFADCTALYSGRPDGTNRIIIPASVTSIGAHAFENCVAIKQVDFSGGELSSIGEYAFANCTGIGTTPTGLFKTTIEIPANVTTIGAYAFYNCSGVARLNLNKATSKLATIGAYAFANWTTLGRNLEGEVTFDTLAIPPSVVTIGAHAFENAVNLRQLSLEGDKLTTIDDYAFAGCIVFGQGGSGLTNEDYELKIPNTVITIGKFAFAGTLATPNKVRKISFTQDSLLTNIGDYAFAHCSEITEIYLGEYVANIGEGALRGTARLSNIRVALTNTKFLSDSGHLCNRLGASTTTKLIKYATGKTETEYTVPTGIIEIGSYAFEADIRLTKITLPSSVNVIHQYAFEGSSAEIFFKAPTISTIENYAFAGYLGTSLSLPNSLKTLGNYALADTAINAIIIPSTVTTIGSYAFANAPITHISLSSAIVNIAAGAFANCPNLTSIDVDIDNGVFRSIDGVLYEISGGGLSLLQYPSAKSNSEFVVPADVASIKSNAFEGALNLTKITINNTVTSIAPAAFAGLDSLVSITLPYVGLTQDNPTTFGSMFAETTAEAVGAIRQGGQYYLVPASLSTIVVTDIQGLANYAFQNVTVGSITLGGALLSIGIYAFENCLAEVSFGQDCALEKIAAYAFAGYAGGGITIPQHINTIEEYAFYNSQISHFGFGESNVVTIGQYAFANTGLATLVVPDSVESIGKSALEGASKLTELVIPFIGANVSDTENTLAYLFGYSPTASAGAIAQTRRNGTTSYSVIPAIQNLELTVATSVPVGAFMNVGAATIKLHKAIDIQENAFKGCSAQVSFSGAITTIGANAFNGYTYSGAFELPTSVVEIMPYAFFASGISDIVFKEGGGLIAIDDFAFAQCAALGAQTEKLTLYGPLNTIGESAFYATAIKSVDIPDSVSFIGYSAFGMCLDLSAINVASTNPNYKDTAGSLYNKAGSTLLQYPANSGISAVTLPAGVTAIGNYAFAGNTAIISIEIPASVTYIGEYAFAGTEDRPMSLTTATFIGQSQLNEIDESAFAFCTSLVDFTLPRSVQFIRYRAFAGSAVAPMSIQTIVFAEGSGIQQIGEQAFAYCSAIKNISIPAGIVMIGHAMLMGCDSLQSLTLPYIGATRNSTGKEALLGYIFGESVGSTDGTTKQYYGASEYGYFFIPISLQTVAIINSTRITYGAFYGCGTIEVITFNNDVSIIGDYAFYMCTSLRNISIPARVTAIGEYAFAGTNYRPMSLETVNISTDSNLSNIGVGAFYNCASLQSLYLPSNVAGIPAYTFYNSQSLSSFTLGEGSRLINIGDYAFYASGLPMLEVPADFRTIGQSAFENSTISTFTIKAGVYRLSSIGNSAFSGCANLQQIFIPNTLTANGMGDRVFYNCTGLQSVEFGIGGILSNLGEYAFYNCSSLQSIVLPQAITNIGEYQFYGCNALSTIEIPATVASIGNYAFAGKGGIAMGLQSVSFADSAVLQSIGENVFNLCYSLTSVQLPDSLMSIGQKAFYNCNKLSDLQIGADSQLQTIGEYAFSGCTSLASIRIPKLVDTIATGVFRNTNFDQINVDVDNNYFMSHEGNLLSKDGLEFIKYASGNARDAYVIPSTIKTIRGYAFADAANLVSLELPDGLSVVGEFAFSGVSRLTAMSIPQTVYEIGTYAFAKASKLTVFEFEGNSELVSLGEYAFFQCASLIEITLPSGITKLPDSLFYGCTTLYKVSFGYLTEIGNSAFYNCASLTQIVLPLTLQSIGDYAFYNCSSLLSVTLGDSLTVLGGGAFSGCQSLSQINVGANNPQFVSSGGVLYTKSFSNLLIYPAGKTDAGYIINSRTTSISSYAFLAAKHLKSMTLPSRISYIGYRAFYGASSLVLYSQAVSQPSGWDAGYNSSCPIYWGASVNNYGADFQFIIDGDGNATITRYLGDSTSFTFPQFVETIDSEGDIPVIGIGSGAMLGVNHVHSVLILSNITYIGARAFDDNAKLTIYAQAPFAPDDWQNNWNIDSRPVYWSVNDISSDGNFEYIVVNSANVTITRYVGTSLNPVIPNMIESVYVTKIGAHAFSASNIKSITLPENLQTIEMYAFAYSGLLSVTLPAKVRVIGNFAFAYCQDLVVADISPDFGALTTLGWSVFAGCIRLEQIVLPITITTVGGQVFRDCANVEIIIKHDLPSGEPTEVPTGYNINWHLKGYQSGEAIYHTFIWQHI